MGKGGGDHEQTRALCRLSRQRPARDGRATGSALVYRSVQTLHPRGRRGSAARAGVCPDQSHRPLLDEQPAGGLVYHRRSSALHFGRCCVRLSARRPGLGGSARWVAGTCSGERAGYRSGLQSRHAAAFHRWKGGSLMSTTATATRGSGATTSLLDGTWPLRPFHPEGFVGALSADGQQVRVAALACDEERVVALSLVGFDTSIGVVLSRLWSSMAVPFAPASDRQGEWSGPEQLKRRCQRYKQCVAHLDGTRGVHALALWCTP